MIGAALCDAVSGAVSSGWDWAVYALVYVLAWGLWLVGVAGCVLPYPGHLFILMGCGVLEYYHGEPHTAVSIWVALVGLAILGMFVDFLCSLLGAKKFGCSRAAIWCSAIGFFIGAFFFPLGIILGPFSGALFGELVIARRDFKESSKSSVGALMGALAGMGAKLVIAGVMIVLYLVAS